jgi:hypothetical protein
MKRMLLLFFTISFLSACAPTTEITGSWKNPQVSQKQVSSILITSLTDKTNVRQTVEKDLTSALEQKSIKAIKSIDILPPSFTEGKEPDKDVLLDKIKGTEVDAILTVALIDKETENRYVPGTFDYRPMTRFGYYGRFWGYYTQWYPTLYSPGYYTEDKVYFMETNLYDADTEELLWSAQSETYNPVSLSDFSKELSSIVLKKMESDGVL